MLRYYQQEAVDSTFEAWLSCDYCLAVLATGCGKTVIFSAVIDRFLQEHPDKRVMVLAHREELVFQAAEKIGRITGRPVTIEMGDKQAAQWFGQLSDHIIVSTIQTQLAGNNGGRMLKFDPAEFGLVVVDEAHHAVSPSYISVLKHYRENKDCKVLGVTATPDRADEEALGKVFETVTADYDMRDAIADGWLTPIRQELVTVTGLDFSGIRTTTGDLNGADLAEVMEAERNLYGIADATREVVGSRKTLIFTVSVKQAQMLSDILNRYTADSARYVDGTMDKQERREVVSAYAEGKFQFLINCAVFTEGFDVPDVSAVVIARPTKSRSLYAQMIGRGTRPAESVAQVISVKGTTAEYRRRVIEDSAKPDCLVLDFEGNAGRHKLVTSVDILGACGSNAVDGDIIAIAKRKLKEASESGKPMMTAEAIEEAKEEARLRHLEEVKRRAQLRAKATFSAISVDPFDIFGIQRTCPSRGRDTVRRLSDKQVAVLQGIGIENVSDMSYRDGTRLLHEHFRRMKEGRPTLRQERMLRRMCYGMPVRTKEKASEIIDQYFASKGRR